MTILALIDTALRMLGMATLMSIAGTLLYQWLARHGHESGWQQEETKDEGTPLYGLPDVQVRTGASK